MKNVITRKTQSRQRWTHKTKRKSFNITNHEDNNNNKKSKQTQPKFMYTNRKKKKPQKT